MLRAGMMLVRIFYSTSSSFPGTKVETGNVSLLLIISEHSAIVEIGIVGDFVMSDFTVPGFDLQMHVGRFEGVVLLTAGGQVRRL